MLNLGIFIVQFNPIFMSRKNNKFFIFLGVIVAVIVILVVLFVTNLFHFRNFVFKYIPAPKFAFMDLVGVNPLYFPSKTAVKWEGLLDEASSDQKGWFSVQLPKGWVVNKTKTGNGFYTDRDNVLYALYVWSAIPEQVDPKTLKKGEKMPEVQPQKIFTLDDFVKWRTSTYEKLIVDKTTMKIGDHDAVLVWARGAQGFKTLNIYMHGKDYRFYESALRGAEENVDLYKYIYIYSLQTLKDL